MKYLISILFVSLATIVTAHTGHPGPEDHGNATHFLLGVLVGLPLAWGLWILLRNAICRQTDKITLSKEKNTHG